MSDALAVHACDRAAERYGITLTLDDLREVEERLARGEGMMIRRNPDGARVVVIRVQGLLATVAVSPVDGRIKTFLPADAPMKRLWRQR